MTESINQTPTFGEQLRNIRERVGLSDREAAKTLKVRNSTYREIEDDIIPPPRGLPFYYRLRDTQGISESDVVNLLRADGVPNRLISKFTGPKRFITVPELPGIEIPVFVDMGMLSEDQLNAVLSNMRPFISEFFAKNNPTKS